MAPSLTDGAPGIEGLHTLAPPSPFSTFTLNDWMDPSTGKTRTWADQAAWTRVETIEGLHSAPEMDDPRVKKVYQRGEKPLPRLPRGKTITYHASVFAETKADMNARLAEIRTACMAGLIDPEDWTLVATYNSTYDATGLEFTAYGIPVGFECDEGGYVGDTIPSPWRADFMLSYRMSDGVWLVTNSGALCSVGSSGSPIDDGSNGTLAMTGTAPAEPVFTVYGSGSGEATVVFTGSEVGGKLTVDLPAHMASGDTLVVDFHARTVTFTHSATAHDYSGYIDWANTNWWNEADVPATLLIGDNTLNVAGDPWSATARPAVW